MNLQIKDNQYLPYGFGKPASTYYYIVDVDSTKKSKYLSKKTGKFITSTAFDIKYDGFYNEEQAESFLKNYLKNEKPSGVKSEGKLPMTNIQKVKRMIRETILKEATPQDNKLLKGYLDAALWSSTDDNDDPLDSNYRISDIAPESINKSKTDAVNFLMKARKFLPADVDMEQVGHDFWLTRNGHGSGFFDADYLEDNVKKTLDKIAGTFKPVHMYVGDDSNVYID